MVLMFGTLNAQNNQHNMDVVVKLLSERKAAIVRDKSELGKIDQQIRRFGELGEKKNVAAMNGIYREISASLTRELKQAEVLLANDTRQVIESTKQVRGSKAERTRSNARDARSNAPAKDRAAADDRRDLQDDRRDRSINVQQRRRQEESTMEMRTLHDELVTKRFTSSTVNSFVEVKKKLDMFLQLMRQQQSASEIEIRQLEKEVKEIRMEQAEDAKNGRQGN